MLQHRRRVGRVVALIFKPTMTSAEMTCQDTGGSYIRHTPAWSHPLSEVLHLHSLKPTQNLNKINNQAITPKTKNKTDKKTTLKNYVHLCWGVFLSTMFKLEGVWLIISTAATPSSVLLSLTHIHGDRIVL